MAVLTFVKADTLSRLLGPGILAAGVPVYRLFRGRSKLDRDTDAVVSHARTRKRE